MTATNERSLEFAVRSDKVSSLCYPLHRSSLGLPLAVIAAATLLLVSAAPAEASRWRILRHAPDVKPAPPRPPQPELLRTDPTPGSPVSGATTVRAASPRPSLPGLAGNAGAPPLVRNHTPVSRAEIRTLPKAAHAPRGTTPPKPQAPKALTSPRTVKPQSTAPKSTPPKAPAPELAASIPKAAPGGSVTVRRQDILPQPASARLLYGSHKSGPYGSLEDHHSVGLGKAFTDHQKRHVRQTNQLRNHLQLRDDHSGVPLQQGEPHRAGVRPPDNEAHVDHVMPKSRGGSNSYSNAELRSRAANLAKSDRTK